MKRNLGLLLVLFFTFNGIMAQDAYEKKVFISNAGDSLSYRELRPEVEKKGEKYPLVIFLHGAGERGSDNEKQLIHGGQMWLNPVNRDKYPAFVIAPQCPETGYWAYRDRPETFNPSGMPQEVPTSQIFVRLKALIDSYLANPQIDKSRVYIIGLSMGAMGTFDMTIRYPEIFAAAIPICGTVNPARLKSAKNVAFRIYHGDADNVVPVDGSREAYKALKKAGANVQYIEYPGINHGSWTPAFNDTEFMTWLFSQKKK